MVLFMLTNIQLECYEHIAKKIYTDGQSSIIDGNPCPENVALLSYVENIFNEEGQPSPLVSALFLDLSEHNQQALTHLRDLGDDSHGYV